MTTHFAHLESNAFQARLYPAPAANGASAPSFGVCLSGGGSRALTCALGQLSGLRSLPDPDDPARTLLDRVKYLSSVSGGSWASVLFTFLPLTIDGQPVSDDDFLIAPLDPANLRKQDASVKTQANVAYLAPYCLGTAPGHFNPHDIAQLLYRVYDWGLFGSSAKRSWWWIAAVGELILKPFGLYAAFYDSNIDFIQPSSFFSLSDDYIKTRIQPDNPTIDPTKFYTCRAKRPALFVNTNLMQNFRAPNTAQLPIQATPIDTGILGQSPDGAIVGGGSVESFTFTSTLAGAGSAPNLAAVTETRRYSLCDIAGCSSAFFAAALLTYINMAFNDIMAEVKKFLQSKGFKDWEIDAILIALKVAWGALIADLEADASELIPQYNYWPLGAVTQTPPVNATYGFSDGGNFDNTGILGLLARTDANRVIAFINGETALSKDPNSHQVLVDGQLPLVFGYHAKPINGTYQSYGGMQPGEPLSYVQVFADAGDAFKALRQGLYDASCGGANMDASLGTCTAAFVQKLTTVDNPVAHIKGGREVTVLWIYNNRVGKWQDAITDAGIKTDLSWGQSTPPLGPLARFPHYDTGLQIGIGAEPVNMLAQLSAWNVRELKDAIAQLLAPGVG
jgi:hypothetical protein